MALLLVALMACNPDPGELDQGVEYRDGTDGGGMSGERGTVKISEILWSGTVTNDGTWDPTEQFIEIRNEGVRNMNISGWRLEVEGSRMITYIVPQTDVVIPVGEQIVIANKEGQCLRNVDILIPDLSLPYGDPFRITLMDMDEHLIEPAGNKMMPPYAGVYDGQVSRSMEKVALMFGGRGSEPTAWHHATDGSLFDEGQYDRNYRPDNIAEECRQRTFATPGEGNSPDYSGNQSFGGFE